MTMFKCKGVGGSPTPSYNYELYNYIYTENSGESFNTGITYNVTNPVIGNIELKFQSMLTSSERPSSGWVGIFGAVDTSNKSRLGIGFTNTYYYMYYHSGTSYTESILKAVDNEEHIIKLVSKRYSGQNITYYTPYMDSKSGLVGSIPKDIGYPFLINAFNNTGTPTTSGSIKQKLFYLKIYSISDSTKLLYNFTPAKQLSTSEIGLYDTVNKVFYPSMGDGNFITGDPIGYA